VYLQRLDSSPLDLCCFVLHLCQLSLILTVLFRSLSLSRLITSPLLTLLSFLDFSFVIHLTWSPHVTCDSYFQGTDRLCSFVAKCCSRGSRASAKLQKHADACPGPVAGVIGPRAPVLAALPLGMRIAHSRGTLCSLIATVRHWRSRGVFIKYREHSMDSQRRLFGRKTTPLN